MAYNDVRTRIEHMLEAIDAIAEFTRGKSFADYTTDRLLRAAIERHIERMSEASRHIPNELKGRAPAIPWRNIAGIGNILRHDYEGVDNQIIWNLIREQLGQLRLALEAMLPHAEGC